MLKTQLRNKKVAMIKIKPIWDSNSDESIRIWELFDKMIEQIKLREKLKKHCDEIQNTSEALYNFLFDDQEVRDVNLNKLLKTRTDYSTLNQEGLIFLLNEGKTWMGVKNIFNYNAFSRSDYFSKLVQMMGVSTCPYCNRAFTSTVEKEDGEIRRHNQIDHYMSQDSYPYLALTLPNMVPVCADCNHKKGLNKKDILYPYKEGFDDKYHFVTHPVSGCGYLIGETDSEADFCVSIEKIPGAVCDKDYCNRIDNARELLDLDQLYNTHNKYVLRIFEQHYIFGKAYIEDLIESFPEYFKSKEDVKKMLYMKSIHPDDFSHNPLSRLTFDIDNEISSLTSKK